MANEIITYNGIDVKYVQECLNSIREKVMPYVQLGNWTHLDCDGKMGPYSQQALIRFKDLFKISGGLNIGNDTMRWLTMLKDEAANSAKFSEMNVYATGMTRLLNKMDSAISSVDLKTIEVTCGLFRDGFADIIRTSGDTLAVEKISEKLSSRWNLLIDRINRAIIQLFNRNKANLDNTLKTIDKYLCKAKECVKEGNRWKALEGHNKSLDKTLTYHKLVNLKNLKLTNPQTIGNILRKGAGKIKYLDVSKSLWTLIVDIAGYEDTQSWIVKISKHIGDLIESFVCFFAGAALGVFLGIAGAPAWACFALGILVGALVSWIWEIFRKTVFGQKMEQTIGVFTANIVRAANSYQQEYGTIMRGGIRVKNNIAY